MIRGIRLAKAGILVGMGLPIEVTAIYDTTTDAGRVAIHIFRSRVGHDIGTPFERAAIDRCREGVIDNEWHTLLVGNPGELLDVEHHDARVRQCLTEEQFRVRTERLGDLLLTSVLVNESAIDSQFLQRDSQKVVGSTIDAGGADDMVARLADIKEGEEVGCLS